MHSVHPPFSGIVHDGPDKTEGNEGIVHDGPDKTEGNLLVLGVDVDYQSDLSTVTVQFAHFESALHGVMTFEMAVGTTQGGEEIMPYTEQGIMHYEEDNVAGNGKYTKC